MKGNDRQYGFSFLVWNMLRSSYVMFYHKGSVILGHDLASMHVELFIDLLLLQGFANASQHDIDRWIKAGKIATLAGAEVISTMFNFL